MCSSSGPTLDLMINPIKPVCLARSGTSDKFALYSVNWSDGLSVGCGVLSIRLMYRRMAGVSKDG